MQIFRAKWLCPIEHPPIEGGAMAVQDGRITAVGPFSDMPPGEVSDFGETIVLPGLINAHTHLELTGAHGLIPPMPLFDWFERLLELFLRGGVKLRGREAVLAGAGQSLAAGVTCVGDISRSGVQIEALAASPIRKVCFLECISGGQFGPGNAAELEAAVERAWPARDQPSSFLGVSPHATYSVSPRDLREIANLAQRKRLPMTMHLLETREERQWLESGGGPVAGFLSRHALPDWPEQRPTNLFLVLAEAGVLNAKPLLAHVNYVQDREIEQLAEAGASVAFCPRAHRYFGHAPHRWKDMLAAGVNLCIATDSLASNNSLSPLDEIRFMHQEDPDVAIDVLLEMITARAAAALKLEKLCGGLATGKFADFTVFDCGPSVIDPLIAVLESQQPPKEVWIAGRGVHST